MSPRVGIVRDGAPASGQRSDKRSDEALPIQVGNAIGSGRKNFSIFLGLITINVKHDRMSNLFVCKGYAAAGMASIATDDH